MKKLTAGIFTVLMGLVSVNAADAAVASKGYVTQEINKVNENVTAVDTKVGTLGSLQTTSKTDVVAAINELKTNLDDATGGSTGRLDAIEESLTETGDVGSKIKANADAISALNGTGEGSVASKIAAAVKTEEDARKAADTSLQGEIDAAEVRLDTIEADYATKAYADAKVDNAAIGDDAATKTTVAPSVAQVAAYVDNNFADVDGQISGLTASLGTANEGIADNAAAIEELKTADTTINGKIGGEFTAENTVADAIAAASSAASAAQADADALELLVGTTKVSEQISGAITGLDLANTYEAKGAAATAESNAKAYALGKANTAQTNAVGYTDSVIAALQPITRVPADCSDENKYCALTYGKNGFVWEVIERGDDELNEQGGVVYNPTAVTLAVNPTDVTAPTAPGEIK